MSPSCSSSERPYSDCDRDLRSTNSFHAVGVSQCGVRPVDASGVSGGGDSEEWSSAGGTLPCPWLHEEPLLLRSRLRSRMATGSSLRPLWRRMWCCSRKTFFAILRCTHRRRPATLAAHAESSPAKHEVLRMQWVFDEIFFCGLISHLPGPRVCRFKNTGTNAVRTTLRLVLLMKNDSHFRFLTSLLPPYRPLFETPTHLDDNAQGPVQRLCPHVSPTHLAGPRANGGPTGRTLTLAHASIMLRTDRSVCFLTA